MTRLRATMKEIHSILYTPLSWIDSRKNENAFINWPIEMTGISQGVSHLLLWVNSECSREKVHCPLVPHTFRRAKIIMEKRTGIFQFTYNIKKFEAERIKAQNTGRDFNDQSKDLTLCPVHRASCILIRVSQIKSHLFLACGEHCSLLQTDGWNN